MSVRMFGRMALAWVLLPVLAIGSLAVPVDASATSHPAPSPIPDKRHRPWWLKVLDKVSHGASPGSGCRPNLAGSPQPVIHGLQLCLQGFAEGDQPVLHISTADGGTSSVLGEGDSTDAEPQNNQFRWDLPRTTAGVLMSRPGKYRYEVTAEHTPTTSGYIVVEMPTTPSVEFSVDYVDLPGLQPVRGSDLYETRRGYMVIARVGGFKPGSTIFADLYSNARDDDQMRWLEDLPPAVADRYGRGTILWYVTKQTPLGKYALLIEPVAENSTDCHGSCQEFEVAS